jgi:hypothetical protein
MMAKPPNAMRIPGIDIEPRKRGKDAESRSISIFANRRAEELVELRPDERRQRGVGHVSTRSSSRFSATQSEAAAIASAL